MPIAESEGIRIYYDDRGKGEPALLCLPGLGVHHTIFLSLAERLSAHHRVLAMDWRGHGKSDAADPDFGFPEMIADALAVIQAGGAESVIPITQAHAGWVAIGLRERLGERVPRMIFCSWNPIFTHGNLQAGTFLGAMQKLQDKANWREALEGLVSMWVAGAPSAVETQIREETESHGFEDWSRRAREVSEVYARKGDPLQVLSKLNPPPPVLHVYAQPRVQEYLATQEAFARDHPWFSVRRLHASSHFPTLEAPDETADVIREFIA